MEQTTTTDNELALRKAYDQHLKDHSSRCPKCGYCSHCGRGGYQFPNYPAYPGWGQWPDGTNRHPLAQPIIYC